MVVMPTKEAIAANHEAGEIATRAADIMLANALRGIADYTKKPPTSIKEMKLYKGKLSMVKFFSKFNPYILQTSPILSVDNSIAAIGQLTHGTLFLCKIASPFFSSIIFSKVVAFVIFAMFFILLK